MKTSARPSAQPEPVRMLLIPCSCATTFAVADGFDHKGSSWSRYASCPACGKRHDPKNRALLIRYQRERFWQVEEC